MSLEFYVYCRLMGKDFSPKKLEIENDINLSDKLEFGDIPRSGTNKPINYGVAYVYADEGKKLYDALENVVEKISNNINSFKNFGATSLKLHISVFYSYQCNMEFDPELLKRIADLGVTFTLSCVEVEEEDIES